MQTRKNRRSENLPSSHIVDSGISNPLSPHPFASDIELAKLFDPDYRLDARACAEAWAKG